MSPSLQSCVSAWAGVICISLVAATVPLKLHAQEVRPSDVAPGQLVRETANNEVPDVHTSTKFMFRSRKQTPKGSQTRMYVETDQAMAGMLIAVNDQPLTPEQKQAEINHLNWLQGDPEALRKKHAHEKEDAEHTARIMKALPDAFQYENAGTEKGSAQIGGEGRELVRLKFRPNPSYSPPSHVEQVLTGMEGYLLIDPEARRIARIDGTLFKGVSFGWGIVGHLDKGSTFRVQQADVGEGAWEITEMRLNITGKILIFKSLTMISDEIFSDFHRVPDNLSFSSAVELLKSEENKFAKRTSPSEANKTPQ